MIPGRTLERPPISEAHPQGRSAMRRAGVWAATAILALLALMAIAVRVGATGPESDDSVPAVLKSLSWRSERATTSLLIEASAPVAYVTSQPNPLTVVVDLRNVAAGTIPNTIDPPPNGLVSGVDVEDARADDGTVMARVRIVLAKPSVHRVRSARNVIVVDIDGRGVPNAARKAAAPAEVAPVPSMIAPRVVNATELQAVRLLSSATTAQVVLSGNGRLVAASVKEADDLPPRLLLDFVGVASSAPALTTSDAGPIERVRVGTNNRSPLVTRVVIDLARRVPFTIVPDGEQGRDLRITFDAGGQRPPTATAATVDPMSALAMPRPSTDPSAGTLAALAAPVSAQQAPAPAAAPLPPIPSTPLYMRIRAANTQPPAVQPPPVPPLPGPAQTPPAPAPQPPPGATLSTRSCGDPPYVGIPISLDFQGTDLRSVLRIFADVSGLNIVIEPSVQGSVDVQLRDVPWDQALAMILKSNRLGCAIEGNIVRIATITELAAEQKQRQELAVAQTLAGDTATATRTLSYARADELAQLITRSVLTQRGSVQVDTRTNTLIITDLPAKLPEAISLLAALDTPQPQVEIEARIVETTRNFARDLGITWGISGRMAPELGNTTNLAFPNQAAISGRIGGANGGFQGPPSQNDAFAPTAISLGAGAANTNIGLSLGSVNGAVNLDVALSMLETTGKGRLLSTPRVSTQNNIEAEITQGVEIPIQTIANNTVTVTFKPASLTLRVTPQITAAGTVIMKISVENASPDFTRSVNNIPPINTQRANTQVLVNDGQTTVIGGVYTSTETSQKDSVPGLNRIPLLGWLFKRDSTKDESRELLIFITPRIIKL